MRPVLRSKAKDEKFVRPKPASPLATKAPERLEKALTGITGLDEVTFGGLPRGRATLITGSPGCGKTMLGVEFLVNGARMYSEPGVFVAFEETKDELVANAASLKFDLDKLTREGMLAIDHVHVDPNEIAETGDYTSKDSSSGLDTRSSQSTRSEWCSIRSSRFSPVSRTLRFCALKFDGYFNS